MESMRIMDAEQKRLADEEFWRRVNCAVTIPRPTKSAFISSSSSA